MIFESLEAQRTAKHALVCAHLTRAKIFFPDPRWQGEAAPFAYRNRLRLRIEADGQVVFFNQHKARGCAVLEPDLERFIAGIRARAGERPALFRPFAHLEARAADADGKRGLCLYPREPGRESAGVRAELERLESGVLVGVSGWDCPAAIPRQRWALAPDVDARVPVDAFMQINTLVNRELLGALRAFVRRSGSGSFLDLFAGAGNLSLPLLKDGLSGTAAEQKPSAVEAFRAACDDQRLRGAASVCDSAENAARSLRDQGARFDLVILDAPRAGVRHGLDAMAALARKHVAVCSCNPETLARDLKQLVAFGFLVQELLLFDMFPQTRHVEVLALLARSQ